MLRNGDAHLKNFGVLYSSTADVRLAPLYDLVTTTGYAALRNDVPALPLDGRRAWRLKPGTWTRFAQQHCALSPAQTLATVEQLAKALAAEVQSIKRHMKKAPDKSSMLTGLIAQWNAGVADVRAGL